MFWWQPHTHTVANKTQFIIYKNAKKQENVHKLPFWNPAFQSQNLPSADIPTVLLHYFSKINKNNNNY